MPTGQELIPELAETWEVSDGGKTLTFHLHQGVKWHDGASFSSAGSVSKVELVIPMTLIDKALLPSISTFETPPDPG